MNMNRWIIFPELCLYSTRHNELDNGILSSFLNKKQKHYKSLVFVENMTYAFMKYWVEGEPEAVHTLFNTFTDNDGWVRSI